MLATTVTVIVVIVLCHTLSGSHVWFQLILTVGLEVNVPSPGLLIGGWRLDNWPNYRNRKMAALAHKPAMQPLVDPPGLLSAIFVQTQLWASASATHSRTALGLQFSDSDVLSGQPQVLPGNVSFPRLVFYSLKISLLLKYSIEHGEIMTCLQI